MVSAYVAAERDNWPARVGSPQKSNPQFLDSKFSGRTSYKSRKWNYRVCNKFKTPQGCVCSKNHNFPNLLLVSLPFLEPQSISAMLRKRSAAILLEKHCKTVQSMNAPPSSAPSCSFRGVLLHDDSTTRFCIRIQSGYAGSRSERNGKPIASAIRWEQHTPYSERAPVPARGQRCGSIPVLSS